MTLHVKFHSVGGTEDKGCVADFPCVFMFSALVTVSGIIMY